MYDYADDLDEVVTLSTVLLGNGLVKIFGIH